MPKYTDDFDPNDYAPVAERIRLFYERFPVGRIETELVSHTATEIVFRALVFRTSDEVRPAATGWASERQGDGDINTVACLENTETSAIGRALANLGFTASRHRPSAEEMAKAARARASHNRDRAESPSNDARLAPVAARTSPAAFVAKQREADAVSDFIDVLRTARRVGLRERRATLLRTRALRGRLSLEAQARIASRVRRWIAADVERAVALDVPPPPASG